MRVVFMGTPAFAVPSLEGLLERHRVVGVYTQPDRPAGRGRTLRSPAVKRAAQEAGVPVHQPERLDDDGIAVIRELDPDVICVAAYGLLLPPELLEIPLHGCLNVHASLLPRHRGAAPVHRAILEGDDLTGVSIMRMEEGLDTGPVATTRTVAIDRHGASELTRILARLGAEALIDTLDRLRDPTLTWEAQDEDRATYAAKLTCDDVALDPHLTVGAALRRVQASSRRFPSRLHMCDTEVAALESTPVDEALEPGALSLDREGPILGFADGSARLVRLKPAGRAAMSGVGFVCGATGSHLSWGPPA